MNANIVLFAMSKTTAVAITGALRSTLNPVFDFAVRVHIGHIAGCSEFFCKRFHSIRSKPDCLAGFVSAFRREEAPLGGRHRCGGKTPQPGLSKRVSRNSEIYRGLHGLARIVRNDQSALIREIRGNQSDRRVSVHPLREKTACIKSPLATASGVLVLKFSQTNRIESMMETPKHVRVMIVNNEPVTRCGIAAVIDKQRRFSVCAQTGEAPAARELFLKHRPDLVVLSLRLKRGDGIGLIKDFRKLNPAARVLVLSAQDDPAVVQRAFKAGASGYVVKEEDTAEILTAIQRILDGQLYASERVSSSILEQFATGAIDARRRAEEAALSDRELQVLQLIG